jgi:hypothetical protein
MTTLFGPAKEYGWVDLEVATAPVAQYPEDGNLD